MRSWRKTWRYMDGFQYQKWWESISPQTIFSRERKRKRKKKEKNITQHKNMRRNISRTLTSIEIETTHYHNRANRYRPSIRGHFSLVKTLWVVVLCYVHVALPGLLNGASNTGCSPLHVRSFASIKIRPDRLQYKIQNKADIHTHVKFRRLHDLHAQTATTI
jgi:hypothetical protein